MFKNSCRTLSVVAMVLAVGGCASRSASNDPVQGRRLSIKDSDERIQHLAPPVRTPTAHPKPRSEQVVIRATQFAASQAPDPVPQTQRVERTAARPATIPAAVDVQRPAETRRPVAVVEEKSVEMKVAAAPIVPKVIEPAQTDTRPMADVRRGSGPAPVALAPIAPVPKAAEPAMVTPPSNKMDDKTRETLKLADVWMRQNNVGNARTALADAVHSENPELLTALAATYDPVALQRYPKLAGQADSNYALSFYSLAISKGSAEAKEALAKMQAFLGKK
jgi:hypothetical protein